MALSKGKGYQYQKRSADAVKKRADQEGGNFDSIFKGGVDTFRPKQGTNIIRFLPPTWEDPEHYGYDIWVHQYVGADSGSYLCLKKMLSKSCPICEAQKEAADAGEEEEAKQLRAVKKVAAWIIDRDDRKPLPKIWLMSWTMDRDIATLCHSEATGKVLMLDDPDTGFDLSFKRTGQQLNTRYLGVAVDREMTPLFDEQKEINRVMKMVEEQPIPDVLLYKPEKYLEGVISGATSKKEKDPDEDDDEKPSRSKRRPAAEEEEEERPSRRRGKPDPEEEEEKPRSRRRADPEEEADEEDEKPRSRRRAEPEEDEEEERPSARRRGKAEPEEDEEEEKPRSKRRAADPEPDEDDEVEEKPRSKRRPEPEEDDDEVEEEKPRSRKRAPEPEEDDDEVEEKPRSRRRA